MYILGITHPVSRNSAACLLKDGKILALAEEERFNRIKHSPYLPPNKSIDYCLKQGGVGFNDLDYIAVGFDSFRNVLASDLLGKATTLFSRARIGGLFVGDLDGVKVSGSPMIMFFKYLIDYYQGLFRLPFDYRDKRVKFVRHHTSHCASAYFVSPFDHACIISADGGGGQEAGMLAVGEQDKITVFRTIPSVHSLGYLYSIITKLLGFEINDGEGKVMGLSAYGNNNRVLPFVGFKDGIAVINHHKMNSYLGKIKLKLSPHPLDKANVNLASSLQKTIEEAYVYMAEYLYKKTGIKNFCLTGGVSLNCLANTQVLKSEFVDDVFVQPLSSDAGTSLGAALQVYVDLYGKRPGFVMDHVYLGPEFSGGEIEKAIKKAEIPYYKKYKNIERVTAHLLAKGHIIGWFQGRMEAGPRALGNRSILANPSVFKMKDIINSRVKNREPWRPFAPSLLEEDVSGYLIDVKESPFMILESKVRTNKIKDIVATVHVDGTVRPQTVSRKMNSRYWNLINEFKKTTGIPVLLNTSFNIAGEPIVCKPTEAISTFFRSGLDYLVMGDYLISKMPLRD